MTITAVGVHISLRRAVLELRFSRPWGQALRLDLCTFLIQYIFFEMVLFYSQEVSYTSTLYKFVGLDFNIPF